MKKVLASVLAGSMVLGMAAAASAASTLTLKDSSDSEYKYQLFLYEPSDIITTESEDYIWEDYTQEAFKAFQNEYKTFTKYVSDPKGLYQYFKLREDASAPNVFDLYQEFYSCVQSDANTAKITAKLDFLPNISGSNINKLTSSDFDGNDYIDGKATQKLDGYMTSKGITELKIEHSRAICRIFTSNNEGLNLSPDNVLAHVPTGSGTRMGSGSYVDQNKASIDIADKDQMDDFGLAPHYMYTYGTDDAKEVKFEIVVKHGDDFRVDVASGKVTVSRKRIKADTKNDVDRYQVVVKAAAGVRDFELDDFKIELDCTSANKVYYIEGEVAYSDYREVLPDDRLIIKKSNTDNLHDDGCIFDFSEVIDEETRIICEENYVDLLFKGNYGTDFENLRVMTDDIAEVEDFFQDYDIDYYDFIGTPKFAKDITVRIDADSDSYIYEYDKKTGDVVDITDEAEYTSDGWTFKRKALKTYVILEEPYEGGNVKAEKEPVSEEPDDADEPDEVEKPDDSGATGSKPNPGTGAYPLF